MPPKPKTQSKVAAQKGGKKQVQKKTGKKVEVKAPEPTSVWEKAPKDFGIGNDIQPKRDLTRFTKWPRYVVLQRKRRVLTRRLKVPPSLARFTRTLDANTAANVFKLLNKHRPEDKAAKRARLLKAAEAKKAGKEVASEKPCVVKCGINHVTKLIEEKKATLVVIAHDVDPIELVMYLPALCRKQGVPYCIVKGKARLGQVVHKKTATALAFTSVKSEERQLFSQVVTAVKSQYNDKFDETRKRWGGGELGLKSQAVLNRRLKAAAKEEADKLKYN